MKKNSIKKWTYKIFFYASIFIAILTIPVIGQCECKTNRLWANKAYLGFVLSSGFLLLLIQFFVYTAEFVKDLFILLFIILNKSIDEIHIKIYFFTILIGFLWMIIVLIYSNDGECNILIGPSDSGMTLALLIAAAINYWKVKVIERT